MKKLYKTKALVKEQLENYPETRSNDALLYYRVCEKIDSNAIDRPFGFMLLSLKEFHLPTFESVSRCRRKLQEENIALAANDTVEGFRKLQEEEFREFARG